MPYAECFKAVGLYPFTFLLFPFYFFLSPFYPHSLSIRDAPLLWKLHTEGLPA